MVLPFPFYRWNTETQALHSCPQTSLERWVIAGSENTQSKPSFLSALSTPHSSWIHPKSKTITFEWLNNGNQIVTNHWLLPKELATLQSCVPLHLGFPSSPFSRMKNEQWLIVNKTNALRNLLTKVTNKWLSNMPGDKFFSWQAVSKWICVPIWLAALLLFSYQVSLVSFN